MNSAAPTCTTDLIWWAFLFVLSILGGLVGLLLKKGIIERLDEMAHAQRLWQETCHSCQEDNRKLFVQKEDYRTMMQDRKQSHLVINNRLTRLETASDGIAKQIEMFHADMSGKMTRLTQSFIVRDAVLSLRVDNLSEKTGSSWTLDDEKAVVDRIEHSLEKGLT